MKTFTIGSVLLIASSSVASVYATDFYAGVAYSTLEADFVNRGNSKLTGINMIGGVEVDSRIALEGVIGFDVSDDDIDGISDDLELDQLLGIYVVGNIPINTQLGFYGKLGFVSLKFKDLDSAEVSDRGIAYSVGAKMEVASNLEAALEYSIFSDIEQDNPDLEFRTNSLDLRVNVHF